MWLGFSGGKGVATAAGVAFALAWQLGAARGGEAGAREAYAIVADADATRSNPGAALHELISAHAPCLLLIDEWVAYARQLFGRDDLDGGTFDTQFTFAQTLTEVVKSVPGAMLVVSIPASSETPSGEERERGSDLEVGGLNGREALARLQQVIRRMADQWRPASHRESFEIVRRRLFEERNAAAQADISVVARTFTEFYARHRGEFPGGVGEPAYEERIKAAYPIHPELFDRLYEDWSTLERFQRTRGVLRLMSTVIYALWRANDAYPLIMPATIPLSDPRVFDDLTQYLEDSWKSIIDSDVDGPGALPARIDQDRPVFGQRATAQDALDAARAHLLAGGIVHHPFAEPEIELPILPRRAGLGALRRRRRFGGVLRSRGCRARPDCAGPDHSRREQNRLHPEAAHRKPSSPPAIWHPDFSPRFPTPACPILAGFRGASPQIQIPACARLCGQKSVTPAPLRRYPT